MLKERIITNNETLFTCKLSLNNSTLSLHKQSYADGACFYTLKDSMGNWKVEYGSRDIDGLISQIKHEIKIEEKYKNEDMCKKYPEVQKAYEEVIRWKNDILTNLKLMA